MVLRVLGGAVPAVLGLWLPRGQTRAAGATRGVRWGRRPPKQAAMSPDEPRLPPLA